MRRKRTLPLAGRRTPRASALAAAVAAAGVTASGPAGALDPGREDVQAFVTELADRHGFEREPLGRVLADAVSREDVLKLISRPAEKAMPWHAYRERFLGERRIQRGVEVWREHSPALARAAAAGVPEPVILGIVGVETFFGENTGRHRVLDALATLAFDYPPRSRYFRGELEQFLLMAREESLDPRSPLGSYAGAMGIPQFMPTSFRRFAVDGDSDGQRDLWADWSDVFSSVANYLAQHGWRQGQPVMAPASVEVANLDGLDLDKLAMTESVGSLRRRGVRFDTTLADDSPAVLLRLQGRDAPEYRVGFANFYAITRYNRSTLYASAVSDLADAIAAASRAAETPPAPAESAPAPVQ